jgi:hypothetical protein
MTPNGSGVVGTVTKIEGDKVYIKNAEGKTYSGYLSNTTLAEETVKEAAGNLRSVKVTYSNGDSVTTDMAANLTDEQIHDYFAIGKRFNLGDGAGGDNVQTVTDVEILEDKVGQKTPSEEVYKKQSFKDIFSSMEESEEEMAERFKRELHGETPKKELHKGDNGKFDLAEEAKSISHLDGVVQDMQRMLLNGKTVHLTAKKTGPHMEGIVVEYNLKWTDE